MTIQIEQIEQRLIYAAMKPGREMTVREIADQVKRNGGPYFSNQMMSYRLRLMEAIGAVTKSTISGVDIIVWMRVDDGYSMRKSGTSNKAERMEMETNK